MEINGRYWGTLGLAIEAGIDFPWLACRLAMDGHIATELEYEKGLGYRWMIPFAILHARERRSLRALWNVVRSRPRTSSDLRASDPLPHLAEAVLAWRAPVSPGDNVR
jgi:predicted ATP-grasp superfamily ATP-dependent carboligase